MFPNGHTTSNPRRFDVDIRLICRRPNFDEFPWRKIHVVFMHYFRCNFDGRKIHMVSMYFFDVILMVEKSTLFPLTFIGVILMVEICTLFLRNFNGQRFDIVFGKWQANENIREGFSCIYNFKQLTFSSKSPWCSPVP